MIWWKAAHVMACPASAAEHLMPIAFHRAVNLLQGTEIPGGHGHAAPVGEFPAGAGMNRRKASYTVPFMN